MDCSSTTNQKEVANIYLAVDKERRLTLKYWQMHSWGGGENYRWLIIISQDSDCNNNIEQNYSWGRNRPSATQEFPSLVWTSFFTTKACRWNLSCGGSIKINWSYPGENISHIPLNSCMCWYHSIILFLSRMMEDLPWCYLLFDGWRRWNVRMRCHSSLVVSLHARELVWFLDNHLLHACIYSIQRVPVWSTIFLELRFITSC